MHALGGTFFGDAYLNQNTEFNGVPLATEGLVGFAMGCQNADQNSGGEKLEYSKH